jgi:hypothetical protein
MMQQIDERQWKFLETPQLLDVPALSESTLKSFALIEPWYLVKREYVLFHFHSPIAHDSSRCQHDVIAVMVDAIVHQADIYFEAISSSVETANDGCTFGGDAISLCEFIASGKHSMQELKSFVQSMLIMASNGQNRATKTSDAFRGVRAELIKVRLSTVGDDSDLHAFEMVRSVTKFMQTYPRSRRS